MSAGEGPDIPSRTPRRVGDRGPQPERTEEPSRACENCATPDDDLVLVRRVYVTPESWDTAASEQVVENPELWCISCLSQYPHDVVDPDDPAMA